MDVSACTGKSSVTVCNFSLRISFLGKSPKRGRNASRLHEDHSDERESRKIIYFE